MRKAALILSVLWLGALMTMAQSREGARVAARSNVVAYDDEMGIMKAAYRESPYFMELVGRWNQRQTDSSIVYSRNLEVEKFWRDYRVFLNVRCGKACRVLLNGKLVGYSDDSRHWGEFELNGFLKYGRKNMLSIEAMKNPREALLERDDLSVGLNGEPYLLFKGDPNVSDMTLTADYDATTGLGTLTVDASVFCSKKKGKYYLEVEVWNPDGRTLDRMGSWVVFDKKSEATVSLTRSWNEVEPWSAETPKLYTAVLRLRNIDMEEEELVGARFGFRRVEVKEGLLTLNGKPLTLKGMTYGMEHTEGLAGQEKIRQDLATMKRSNINAVRTAKYSPMDPYFYQLCDEMGFYVVCDANLMPVSNQYQAVSTDKDYIPWFERRVENVYGRYKNHPSIVAWSLGESRDNGVCMGAAYKRLKEMEKSRPVIFSGADYSDNTDIIALNMPTEKVLRQSLEKTGDRPYIMLTSVNEDDFPLLETLWTRVEKNRNLQGGFVDRWPLIGSRLADLKNLYSPLDVHLSKVTIDEAEFMVYNRNDFLNFSNYLLEYTIFTNLRPSITAGDLPLAIDGGGVEMAKLRLPPVELQPGEEIFIRFDLQRRKASVIDPSLGTVVFPLPYKNAPKREFVNKPAVGSGLLKVDSMDVDNTRGLDIYNPELGIPSILFKTKEALIKGYYYSGYDLMDYSPVLQFGGHTDWQREVVAITHRSPDANTVCVDAMLQYKSSGRAMCDVRVTYTFFGTGDVVVDYTLSSTDAFRGDLAPQLMVNLAQRQDDDLIWFGLDREVCFSQRSSGVPGLYSEKMEKMNGATRQQVRWCANVKDDDNLYLALLGSPFTLKVDERKLALSPAADSKAFRLHLRGYCAVNIVNNFRGDTVYATDTLRQRPEDFYAVEMPVVKTGIVDPPQIKASEARFSQPLTVSITAHTKGDIRYTLDGTEPTEMSILYTNPIILTTTTVVKARVYGKDGNPSFTATRKFNYDYIVKTSFSQKPNTPFNVGVDTLLFDGEKGMVDNLSQGWLGFSGKGVNATVELSKRIDVEYITLRYAHAPEMWAFAPKTITIYLSEDGIDYGDTVNVEVPFDPTSVEENIPRVVEMRVPMGKKNVGFVKIDMQSIGIVPSWHRAKGLNPWLLMDEIEVGESTELLSEKN